MGVWISRGLVLWAGLAGLGVLARGQAAPASGPPAATTLVEPPTPLLPRQMGKFTLGELAAGSAGELGGARFNAACQVEFKPDAAAGPGAENCAQILKEDGLLRFAAGEYQGAGQTRVVHAMQFGDATGAFSAFTFYRSKFAEPRDLELDYKTGRAVASAGGHNTLIWAATTVLAIETPITKAEVEDWLLAMPKVGGRRGLAPLLPTYLPAQGLRPESVRYAVGQGAYAAMGGVLPGSDLGWDKSLEVASANYSGKSGRGTLTLLLYPTPQIAGDRGRAIEKAINAQGPATFGMVKMRRIGPLVGVTSGAFSAEQAQSLVAGLHLSEEVTFDQKMPLEFHAEVRKTASLLQNIAVLCGVLILAALLLGLFLGGARAGIRVLMGKPAASEPEFLTINLRGQPPGLLAERDAD